MQKMRKILGDFRFIHLMVALGLFALSGYMMMGEQYYLFFAALSFSGAICGSFIKVIDTIKDENGFTLRNAEALRESIADAKNSKKSFNKGEALIKDALKD